MWKSKVLGRTKSPTVLLGHIAKGFCLLFEVAGLVKRNHVMALSDYQVSSPG